MSTRDTLIEKLTLHLDPSFLEVIDESEGHRGHSGWRDGGETHFKVRIATRHFAGLSRLAQHRMVMDTLKDDIEGGVHALAVEIVPATGSITPANPK